LAAVEPSAAVRHALTREGEPLGVIGHQRPVGGRLVAVSVGKAAVPMAQGALDACGENLSEGIVITKSGQAGTETLPRMRVYEASHPVPDQRGAQATRAILDLVGSLDTGDTLLALISGGGSALLEAPRPPVTLDDLRRTTDLLLRAGAPIQDLNAVRSVLSLVKAGGLRRASAVRRCVTLILSDVLGNDPATIACGPTIVFQADVAGARAVIDRFRLWHLLPENVTCILTNDQIGMARATMTLEVDDVVRIVGDNATFVDTIANAATSDKIRTVILWRAREGEANELGAEWADLCLKSSKHVDLLLGGGEATVSVRGGGVGGRNTEFALAAALALDRASNDEWLIASLASDGDDGATGTAGAIADGQTIARARATMDPVAALRDNDSLTAFEAAGGTVQPGPTGTNVNDVYIGLRRAALN
jgi:hydroxypyruvate reductase